MRTWIHLRNDTNCAESIGQIMIFFTCSDDTFVIYMGADKHENEHLIKWGWPEDIWFHVDSLSSAHVYLRCPEKIEIEDVPTSKF